MNSMIMYIYLKSNSKLNLNLNFLQNKILPIFLNNCKWYVSALYVPGNKASTELSYLKPNIKFDPQMDIEKFQKELDLRGYKIDLHELKKKWDSYQFICSKKQDLKHKQEQCSQKITKLMSENPSESILEQINILKKENRFLKQDVRSINQTLWNYEETVIPELLKLPNEIDEQTPEETSILLKSNKEKPKFFENEKKDHLNIGTNLGLLEYKNPTQYFLCNEAALFEFVILSLSGNILNENDFIRVAGSDFSRSILLEGSGLDHENPCKSFIIQEDGKHKINKLHLVGSASLPSLLAFYTKKMAEPNQFPIRIFSSGRQYVPTIDDLNNYGLFCVCQASVIQVLIHVKEKNSSIYEDEFQKLIMITSSIYDKIGCHYRVVIKPIIELDSSESMRISFEMWSVYLNQYIEVGHISKCGEYFNKRLLFGYKILQKVNYPATITGTLLSVPKILACLFEENPNKFTLSKEILEFL